MNPDETEPNRLAAKLAAAEKMADALRDTVRRVDESEHWWMANPDRGGMDIEKIEAALKEWGTCPYCNGLHNDAPCPVRAADAERYAVAGREIYPNPNP